MIGSARYWREIPQRYRYEAAKCTACGKIHFPPRLVCSACGARTFTKTALAPEGAVETFTIIRVAPTGFVSEAPYAVGIVRLDDGVKVTAQIVDADLDALQIGQRVRVEFRRVQKEGEAGILCYGYKFVPAEA
jgi:uncharacterized protein